MMVQNAMILASMLMISTAMAVNPVDIIGAQVQDQFNINQSELQQKAFEHINDQNFTREHIQHGF